MIIIIPTVKESFKNLVANEQISHGLKFIKEDHERTVEEQIEMTEIPAPPFKEEIRANNYMQRLKDLGLQDVQMDEEGNVYGIRRGTGQGPKVFISAHLDTVFPEGTSTKVTEKDGILYAPGISDDTRGLAEVLCLARACQAADINNIGDIIFGATVGEEGAGNLRGVKAFFSEHDDIDGFLSIDGPRPYQIVYLGTGSFRYTITYKGPGGHSFGAFGVPSATHALGRAVADIANLQTTENPRTTFTVGEIKGGTSVNAIAEEASMNVDLRSNDKYALNTLTDKFLAIVKKAAEDENNRWGSDQLTVTIERFGDRPPSSQSKDDMIVQTAFEAIQSIGKEPILSDPSSTDANYPMSIGIPSLALGRGGRAGGTHTLDEWYDPTDAFIGVQKNFLTLLGLVGVEGISQPLLTKRNE